MVWILICFIFICPGFLFGKEKTPIFFDAQSSSLSQDGRYQTFEGQVMAVSSQVLVSGDEIRFDRVEQSLEASGHVLVVSGSQILGGDRLLYRMDSKHLKLTRAWFISDDPSKSKVLSEAFLGITPQELALEAGRVEQLKKIQEEIDHLLESVPKEDLLTITPQYAALRQKADTIRGMDQPYLNRFPQEKRDQLFLRRKFWNESRAQKRVLPKGYGYFRIQGDKIETLEPGIFYAENASLSPCRCEEGESAPWGIRGRTIGAKDNGYADLTHAVITIKNIPILYLPYMKVPIKNKRQSGFLLPDFSYKSGQGSIYSLPFFWDLGPDQDLTIDSDYYEKRGFHLGLDYRYQDTASSGWHIIGDGGRDELQKSKRGRLQWDGQRFVTDRLSFVTQGTVLGDRRYFQDYEITRFQESTGFFEKEALLYTQAQWQLHWDEPSFYLGVGGTHGDYLIRDPKTRILEEPIRMKYQSRLFSLFPKSRIPVYGSLDYEGKFLQPSTPSQTKAPLGQGLWQKARFRSVIPLLTETAIDANGYADWKWSWIHSHLKGKEDFTRIYSFETGLNLNLPMEGRLDLWENDFLEHKMNWGMGVSYQPFVKVSPDGAYGTLKTGKIPLTFFEEDSRDPFFKTGSVLQKDTLPHTLITFQTKHSWGLGSTLWQPVHPSFTNWTSYPGDLLGSSDHFYLEMAQKELESMMEQPGGEVLGEDGRWQVTRYEKKVKSGTPFLNLQSKIIYDYRAKEKPWSPLASQAGLFLFGGSATALSTYDLEKKYHTHLHLIFTSPALLGVVGSYSHIKDRSIKMINKEDWDFYDRYTKEWGLRGTVFRYFPWALSYGLQDDQGLGSEKTEDRNMARMALGYQSPTQCWGVRFEWTKPYDKKDWKKDGIYLVNVLVKALGHTREYNVLK
jgi:hypothetical protein